MMCLSSLSVQCLSKRTEDDGAVDVAAVDVPRQLVLPRLRPVPAERCDRQEVTSPEYEPGQNPLQAADT